MDVERFGALTWGELDIDRRIVALNKSAGIGITGNNRPIEVLSVACACSEKKRRLASGFKFNCIEKVLSN